MNEPVKVGDMVKLVYDATINYAYYEDLFRHNDGAEVEVVAYRGDALVGNQLYRMFRVHGDLASKNGPITSLIVPGAWLEKNCKFKP